MNKYIEILKNGSFESRENGKSLLQRNEEALDQFKKAFTLDSNSIEFLPAYFNIIECYFLKPGSDSDIKKYLIVGLTNLENAQKKKDDKGYRVGGGGAKEKEEEKKKKMLKSRLELLFARLNFQKDEHESAITKLQNSILSYSSLIPQAQNKEENVHKAKEYFLIY